MAPFQIVRTASSVVIRVASRGWPDQRVAVDVDGRTLTLSNLEKVLYPEDGFTKGEVIDYYARVCETLLPHVARRPATFRRFPNGVDAPSFFEKNAPRGTPDWVRTVPCPCPARRCSARPSTSSSWRTGRPWSGRRTSPPSRCTSRSGGGAARRRARPDLLVLDLDPGPPATVVECCQVALLLREVLVADGLEPVAKTSGSKGLQVYAALRETSADRTRRTRTSWRSGWSPSTRTSWCPG